MGLSLSLLLPFLSGQNILQHRPQIGEKSGRPVRLSLKQPDRKGRAGALGPDFPKRRGGGWETGLSAERPPEVSLSRAQPLKPFLVSLGPKRLKFRQTA